MAFEITRPGKNSLVVETPVMPSAGIFGFGDVYRDLIKVEKLGAIVTNPVTYQPWQVATGTRVIPLDAGELVYTRTAQSRPEQGTEPVSRPVGSLPDASDFASR